MPRLTLLFAFSASVGALKFRDPEPGSLTFDKAPSGFDEMQVTPKGCGVVQYAFGAERYIKEGLRASKYVRSLQVDKGWCAQDPELNHIPVTLFTDHEAGAKLFGNSPELLGIGSELEGVDVVVLRDPSLEEFTAIKCGPGVECRPEEDLPPYPKKDQNVASVGGSWKFRWYHAQVLLKSPYKLTFYLDVDAVPCSGAGVAYLAKRMEDEHGDVGTTLHKHSCTMTPGANSCSSHAPEGANKAEWKKYIERNAGVIVARMHEGGVGRKIMNDFAQDIVRFAGAAKGDQYAFRRALFNHRNESKELIYGQTEVCRYKGSAMLHGDSCKKGCRGIAHEVKGGAMSHIPKNVPLPKDMEEAQTSNSELDESAH